MPLIPDMFFILVFTSAQSLNFLCSKRLLSANPITITFPSSPNRLLKFWYSIKVVSVSGKIFANSYDNSIL